MALTDSLTSRLPTRITRTTRLLAIATLISNIGIMITGGAVRLTASGLGCPEWPRCTPDSWVSTPEMGMHGAIEFGNRLLTYVLIAISLAMFLALVRLWDSHRPLVVRALLIGLGIPLQGVIGGITVWTNLNPWVVGLHFVLSSVLVMLAAQLLHRVTLELHHDGATGRPLVDGATDSVTTAMAPVVLAASWAAVILGTIVTGTGPHAGDPGAPRHDFDADLVTRLHVVPVYVLCAAAVAIMLRQRRLQASPAQKKAAWWLVTVILAQGTIGYIQHFTGLPILLVLFHMLGSALLIATATMVFDRLRASYRTRGLEGASAEDVVSR
ncbi:COX15/CtaA family protein [Nesterenkonia sp. HG001]|uniref:COX15/CtaA family protein n=1 Tax=Nesterenkonia sp. HG001 TaxID=2983207 RepID=UPI002AC4EE4A|nr:COX15/CtaA family protein [Nesterenkonia sp. HG001]MDZ5078345.1 COX15/CtaA family protein [Nesterenkonia sp. HG001]